jgi:hypothetical protein
VTARDLGPSDHDRVYDWEEATRRALLLQDSPDTALIVHIGPDGVTSRIALPASDGHEATQAAVGAGWLSWREVASPDASAAGSRDAAPGREADRLWAAGAELSRTVLPPGMNPRADHRTLTEAACRWLDRLVTALGDLPEAVLLVRDEAPWYAIDTFTSAMAGQVRERGARCLVLGGHLPHRAGHAVAVPPDARVWGSGGSPATAALCLASATGEGRVSVYGIGPQDGIGPRPLLWTASAPSRERAHAVVAVSPAPDASWAAVAWDDGVVTAVQRSGQAARTLCRHSRRPVGMSIGAAGLAVLDLEGTCHVTRVGSAGSAAVRLGRGFANVVAAAATEPFVVVGGESGYLCRIWTDPEDGLRPLSEVPLGRMVTALAVTPDGGLLCVGLSDGGVVVVGDGGADVTRIMDVSPPVEAVGIRCGVGGADVLAVGADGATWYASPARTVVSVQLGRHRGPAATAGLIVGGAVTVGAADGILRLWDTPGADSFTGGRA